jgi:hypothetical protein
MGTAHASGLENYWSLLKWCIKGTYIAIAPFHLNRYLAEQEFRYNERCMKAGARFAIAPFQVEGKRLTYRRLIGRELAAGQ